MRKQKTSKAFVASYFVGATFLILVAGLFPSGSGRVAVFSNPWGDVSAVEIIGRAGAPIVAVGARDWVAVTETSDGGDLARLSASGALFVASSLLAEACLKIAL